MEKKYVMTDETKTLKDGTILHRIQAVRDFGDVKKGDIGGFIEKEENLSHEGNCWVYDSALVFDNAQISGNAKVYNIAVVSDNTHVLGSVRVYGSARIYDGARVFGNARVFDDAQVFGNARVFDNVQVFGDARVFDGAVVCDDATVSGNSKIYNNALIRQHAYISTTADYILIGPIGSRDDDITFYRNKYDGISVSCGWFAGTLNEFIEKVKLTYGNRLENPNQSYYKQYNAAIKCAKISLIK